MCPVPMVRMKSEAVVSFVLEVGYSPSFAGAFLRKGCLRPPLCDTRQCLEDINGDHDGGGVVATDI